LELNDGERGGLGGWRKPEKNGKRRRVGGKRRFCGLAAVFGAFSTRRGAARALGNRAERAYNINKGENAKTGANGFGAKRAFRSGFERDGRFGAFSPTLKFI